MKSVNMLCFRNEMQDELQLRLGIPDDDVKIVGSPLEWLPIRSFRMFRVWNIHELMISESFGVGL